MVKKIIAFDLDDTLSKSKTSISKRMSILISRLLDIHEICIITGGKFEQLQEQVINRLNIADDKLTKIHLMPTCGTRYYLYDIRKKIWELQYSEDLNEFEKKEIIETVEKIARDKNIWPEKFYGEIIEDRNSQISISFLGQEAPLEEKEKWSEKNSNLRLEVCQEIAKELKQFEVRIGGKTTIDITRLGIDKSYGMKKLKEINNLSNDNILFIGDKLSDGGNDYPVKLMGIDTIPVRSYKDTELIVETIIKINSNMK